MNYLADTSAWHHSKNPIASSRWNALSTQDCLWICDQVALEILYSARSAADYDKTSRNLEGFRHAPITQKIYERARCNQLALAHTGGLHHRSVTIADLVIAATAESLGLTVLHYDEDYDRISAVTGQVTEWIAPRGSL
jgi:predicted nucleic acid-binding protein